MISTNKSLALQFHKSTAGIACYFLERKKKKKKKKKKKRKRKKEEKERKKPRKIRLALGRAIKSPTLFGT